MEQKELENKNHELVEKYREKSKQQNRMQQLYTTLKQQQLAAGMELAAEHDAENVLHGAGGAVHNQSNYRNGQPLQSRNSNGSAGNGGRRNGIQAWQNDQPQGSRAGLHTSRKSSKICRHDKVLILS